MKTGFLILIGIVFICTIFFGIIIWRQTVKLEKKALQAKKIKEEYIKKLEEEQQQLLQQECSPDQSLDNNNS